MKSIQRYLLARLVGGAALAIAAAGVAVGWIVVRSLEGQFDRNLADRVQALASILFQVEGQVSFEFSDQLMPEYGRDERPDYFELTFADGRLLERSESLGRASLRAPSAPGQAATFWSASLPDGRRGRFVSQAIEVHHVYPEEGPDRPTAARVHVVLARGLEPLARAERSALASAALASCALIALLAVLAWRAVSRGLEPAKRLADALDRVEIERLPARFDVGPLPRELAPVAQKADALMRRVDRALERERRTTADIAHELRTPISELVTVSEVALRGLEDEALAAVSGNGSAERGAGAVRALGRLRDTAWRMGRSVATLLELARLDTAAAPRRRARVALAELVDEALRPLAGAARARGLAIEVALAAGETVEGDPDVLRIVIANLLDNAVQHAHTADPARAGTLRCELLRPPAEPGAWVFVVSNEAANLCAEDLPQLSQPFWQKDRARSDRQRSGLGLALCTALAERAGLALRFELAGTTLCAALASPSTPAAQRASGGSNGARG